MRGWARRGRGPGRATRARRALGAGAALLLALQSAACASDLKKREGGFRHADGFEIGDAAGPGSVWRPARVEGAALAYRGPEAAAMSWLVGCGRPVASPQLLARQLLIGLEGRRVTSEGAVPVDGGEGWTQRVTAARAGETVHMKTVTTVSGGCVLDWVLVSRAELDPLEADFDRWWSSFRGRSSP